MGDSKTGVNYPWVADLVQSLNQPYISPLPISVPGESVYQAATAIASKIAQIPLGGLVSEFLCNWGVNSPPTAGDESAWKSAYSTIIAALHAFSGGTRIYLAQPWARGQDAAAALMNTWVNDLVALNPSYVSAGINEAIVIKGSDDGYTNTIDGTHYSPAGVLAAAAAWKVIIRP